MTYFRSYLTALSEVLKIMGAVYLVGSFFGGDFFAAFLMYNSILVAFAGPIRVSMEDRLLAK